MTDKAQEKAEEGSNVAGYVHLFAVFTMTSDSS